MSKLEAYLQRIGAPVGPPTLETLHTVQRAHRLAIPFENLEIPLGRGISLDPDRLFAKLVEQGRGGYCFEQNGLFLSMLRALGFEARPLLSRVWLRAVPGDVPPRTHTLLLVRIDGEDHIADAGFGGAYTPPMRLAHGEMAETEDGARHRLQRSEAHGWMLERDGGSGWEAQYSFTTEAVAPDDLEMSNHWTSTRAGTRFTTLRIAARALPDGYASMMGASLTVNQGGRAQARDITDAEEYRAILSETFGIRLSEAEVAALGLF